MDRPADHNRGLSPRQDFAQLVQMKFAVKAVVVTGLNPKPLEMVGSVPQDAHLEMSLLQRRAELEVVFGGGFLGGTFGFAATAAASSFRAEKADIGLPRRGARRLDRGALGAIRGGRGSLLGCAGAEGRGGVVGGVTGRGRTGGCRGRMDGHGSEIITEPF